MSFSFTATVKASKVYTGSTEANTETVTIAGKVYTYQDTLTDVDGNVHVGASDDATIDNLVAAINLSGGVAGTDYAASMTINPHCYAVKTGTAEMTVYSKVTGTVGNLIAIAEAAGGAWAGGATALSGGTGSAAVALNEVQQELVSIRATTDPGAMELHRIHTLEAAIEAID
jgi:hypothetical protein